MSQSSAEVSARAALRQLPDLGFLAGGQFTPVPGGVSNHSWQVTAAGQSFHVRLGFGDEASLGVDRRSEAVLLAMVSEAGLAPPVVACAPDLNLLVMQWIRGRTWSRLDAREPVNLQRVGSALALVHSLPARPGLRRVDFAPVADHLQAQIAATRAPPVEREHRERADLALSRLADRRPLHVPCHNDLHHQNVIEDDGGRLWLVDWEYGGLGDPLVDLAAYCCHHDLDPQSREILVDAHGGLPAAHRSLLDEACVAFDFVQLLWYRQRRLPPPQALLDRLSSAPG